jgi:hypothetical protein
MLQRFYLDVTKVDQGVAWHSQWLSQLLGHSQRSTHTGFPMQGMEWVWGHGSLRGRGRRFWGGMRGVGCDVDTGVAQVSGL